MPTAHSVVAVEVIVIHTLADHAREIETSCEDYDAYKALPAAVTFDGQVFGKKGWNSDKGRAYYGTDKLVAVPHSR